MSKTKNMPITRQVEVAVQPTPQELAAVVASWGDGDQAAFLSALGEADAEGGWWPMQLTYIEANEKLTENGRRMMRLLGEYSLNVGRER